ncbi:muconolactone Delta-isomerase family protein [Streptosporangium sp. NBC_01639]|uniref:muconolactone Delta-isomerase n=1 Tax=unclassified Streptosporangium TaxID=2632669 RepID=UPI002DDC5E4E|nr:muconolactone Delta-isomerase family protein [Streptosporangium sp. NBC_01756]WSC85695.1 muconolactone Delta-isomerase family protein [Streptosporangium sp. NBC_01756]WTD55625.1 muconolactone Delta-isomerase family protein [Streptosporangium sp. NBC_01639]
MEFLVYIELEAPPDMAPALLDELRAREAVHARMLTARGDLVRLWRVPGRWANWGYWHASSADALHEILRGLPLYPLMKTTVHPLDPHPNDPGPARRQPAG